MGLKKDSSRIFSSSFFWVAGISFPETGQNPAKTKVFGFLLASVGTLPMRHTITLNWMDPSFEKCETSLHVEGRDAACEGRWERHNKQMVRLFAESHSAVPFSSR